MNQSKSKLPADTTPENEQVSTSVPPATLDENKPTSTHKRSHAAHLNSGGEEHTKPAGNLRQGSYQTGRRQP